MGKLATFVFANFENGNKDVYFIFFFFFNQKTNILKEMTRKGKINIIIAIFDLTIRYFSNNKCKVWSLILLIFRYVVDTKNRACSEKFY